jgi:hypothetical protein
MTARPVVRAHPADRRSIARAIAARLLASGWRFRRGSSAPWVAPPGARPVTRLPVRPGRVTASDDEPQGYSLLGAAARQAELERRTEPFERHADG